jgi:hypothetical protein
MTYSDAWIDTVDDAEFDALIRERRSHHTPREEKIFLLPPPPRPGNYWINIVRDWAAAQSLAIEYVDPLTIRVRVSRAQLVRFIDNTFGPEPVGKTAALRAHVRARLRDDRTYLIVAAEF